MPSPIIRLINLIRQLANLAMAIERPEMNTRSKTPDRILEASRRLFNEKGYMATSLSEIAAAVGISQGNLSYHFPAKSDLALRIALDVRERRNDRRSNFQPGPIAEDYVDHLLFAMNMTWANRFLLRDRVHFEEKVGPAETHLMADYEDLHSLHRRIEAEGMLRQSAVDDLAVLSRSIWVMSRYWIDYLREVEGLKDIRWNDQERGIEHHFALLLPCLTAAARRDFRAALMQAMAAERALDRRSRLMRASAE